MKDNIVYFIGSLVQNVTECIKHTKNEVIHVLIQISSFALFYS